MEKNPVIDNTKIRIQKTKNKKNKRAKKKTFDELLEYDLHIQEKKLADKQSVRIAIAGNVDSGKSTLVSVLTKGLEDDGKGSARLRVFNYPHEAENGRTSSVSLEIMGFDEKGVQQFPSRFVQNKNKYWKEVVNQSSQIVSLVDLCGHEKYLKTTMFGMVGLFPDYCMIIVGANMGVSRMTKEHLGISLALKLPFFVVVTKIDMTPPEVTANTINFLKKLLTSSSVNRKPLIVDDEKINQTAAATLISDRVCPIFQVSSVTKEGFGMLTSFIQMLNPRNHLNNMIGGIDEPTEFDIHEKFNVTGTGLVVSGTLRVGTIKKGDTLLCGPDKFRKFQPVLIKSIHVNRVPVDEAYSGSFCCLAIKSLNKKSEMTKKDFRKGMCLLSPKIEPKPSWEFDAEIVVLNHSTVISPGYQAVMHCGVITQAVSIVEMNTNVLMTNDKGQIRFKFLYHPEFIKKDSTILLREGRTKILGIVTKVYPMEKGGIEIVEGNGEMAEGGGEGE